MATDAQQQNRGRGYGHRGRRGPDRRGNSNGERRGQQPSQPQPAQQQGRGESHANVENLMRDIRARIARQHGVDLSEQQIQELAARRLESILDVRSVNPALMEQLRRSVSSERAVQIPSRATEPPYQFEDTTIYESTSGLTRVLRRLFNPLLKLLFNPNPIIRALNIQASLNVDAARREAERDQRQAEWNALHYELLQRLVTEVSRVSVEVQAVGPVVESLSAKVDFNERRVRGLEGQQHDSETRTAPVQASRSSEERSVSVSPVASPEAAVAGASVGSDGTRKRRRRRRGRRGGVGDGFQPGGTGPDAGGTLQGDGVDGGGDADMDDGDEGEEMSGPAFTAEPSQASAHAETAAAPPPVERTGAAAPEPVTHETPVHETATPAQAAHDAPAGPEPDRHEL